MANSNNHATIVEEEAPHEIYASLVESSNSRRYAAVACRPASVGAADRTHQRINSNNSNGINRGIHQQHEREGANLITTDIVEQCAEEPSTSQFINFYRKSCETKQYDCNSGAGGGVDKKRASKATNKHSGGAATDATASHNTNQAKTTATATSISNIQYNNAASRASKSYSSKAAPTATTTKSERRRIAKREQERQIQKEKRIRMMLRSDFTEEDELLYRCLHR